jgi:predicted anti-sigma-YlaC factor YlaD
MPTCREMTELVTDRLEGRLAPPEWLLHELHLRGCPACRAYLGQVRATIAALGRLPPEPIRPAVLSGLRLRFRAWRTLV